MNKEKDLSRITIDISQESHKQLKIKAAMTGQSMRDIVVELIEKHLDINKDLTAQSTKK